MTAATLGSTQADCKRMQSTCRAGTVYTTMYTRIEKIQVILTQVWLDDGGIEGSIAHLLYGISRW